MARYSLNSQRTNIYKVKFSKEKRQVKEKSPVRKALDIILLIFTAAVLGYSLIAFGYQTVICSGDSMTPLISDGDRLLCNKYSYKLSGINRGDIVVIRNSSDGYLYVKRVAGCPGDKVRISSGKIYINDKVWDQEYFGNITYAGLAEEEISLGAGQYFVIGDNQSGSIDSRHTNVGNVSESYILGKVTYKIDKGLIRVAD